MNISNWWEWQEESKEINGSQIKIGKESIYAHSLDALW